MKPFDPSLLEAIVAVKDWPRTVLYEVWHRRPVGPVPLWGGMTSNQLIQSWAAEYARTGSEEARGWLMTDLLAQRSSGLFHAEQNSSIYTTYYPAAVAVARRKAVELVDGELVAAIDRYIESWLGMADALACPAGAHSSVAGRMYGPGSRSGDPFGNDHRSDASRFLLRGAPMPAGWRLPDDRWSPMARQPWMEYGILEDAVADGVLPRYTSSHQPRLRSPMVVERCAHGHRAWCDNLDIKHAGFPVWAVSVDYRTGQMWSVYWGDVEPNARKAKLMGGGRIPEALPAAYLGPVQVRVKFGPLTELPSDSIVSSTRTLAVADSGPPLVVRVRPDNTLEVVP